MTGVQTCALPICGFNAAVLGDFTFDIIHPGQFAPLTSLSRSFEEASGSYLSGNTYELTQIVSASQSTGNIWKAGNVVSFAGVAKMSHSLAGAGVDRGFEKQKYKVDYWTGTDWKTFIPKSGSRAMMSDGFAHYNLGSRYTSIASGGELPANAHKLRIVLSGSINPDTSYIKTTSLYQGNTLDPMASPPGDTVVADVDETVILNTTESAKYPYTEITFDNFRLRQSQPRVELSPDGFLIYASDSSYLKMTPEGIDFRGGQGFSQVSTMLAGETNSDNVDVYGSFAGPSLQAYEADTADVSTTGFQGNVNEFAMGNHRHALEFSTINTLMSGQTISNGTWNSGFGSTANTLISGSWQGAIDISSDTNLVGGTGITLTGDTLSTTDSEIVHDSLSGGGGNKHIDHTSVEVTAGTGLTGGGDISSTKTLNVIGGIGITANANDITIDFSDSTFQTYISGSLGTNASLIRSLTATSISGSLGTNASLIRTLTATGISGSLGSNASLIRTLTATGISGSWQGAIDIGTDTNLVGGTGIVLTDDTLSVDISELTTETAIADDDTIAMYDTDGAHSAQITFENLEDAIFSSVSGDITITEAGVSADRKSTRLNSSHVVISYAVFCLKKKKQKT